MTRVERIGRYEVLETLASGGMGVVYKAKDPVLDRVVAVKTLGLGLSPIEAETFRKRFAREAQSAGRLNHPNIVTIHDMGESDGGAYIAMELLEGRTLRGILDSGVVLPPATVADIALQVAEGLAFAHQNDVIHCDIKPGNIMVLESGNVKIMDFGIARLPTGSRTFAGNLLGSPRYISPEQIVGRPVDARSDIFALGGVLYEMLTGVPPFEGAAIDEILYQVINAKPEAPSLRNRSLPPDFDAIVERAMAKHADDRYPSVQAFAAALRKLELAPERVLPELPPLPVIEARPSPPGSATVTIDAPALGAVQPVKARRGVAVLAAAAAVIVMAVGWKLIETNRATQETLTSAASSNAAGSSSAAALRRPPPEITVIPPLIGRPIPEPERPVQRVEAPAATEPPSVATSAGAGVATLANVPVIGAGRFGRIGFAVSPWGEVYIDGRKRGVTPPLTEIKLAPGSYVVEIRNTSFAPYTQRIEVGADATLRIKHKFR